MAPLYIFVHVVSVVNGFLNKDHPKEVKAGNWNKWAHHLLRCSLGIAGESSCKNESRQTTFDYMHQALDSQVPKQIGGINTTKAIMNSQSDVQAVTATSLVY